MPGELLGLDEGSALWTYQKDLVASLGLVWTNHVASLLAHDGKLTLHNHLAGTHSHTQCTLGGRYCCPRQALSYMERDANVTNGWCSLVGCRVEKVAYDPVAAGCVMRRHVCVQPLGYVCARGGVSRGCSLLDVRDNGTTSLWVIWLVTSLPRDHAPN